MLTASRHIPKNNASSFSLILKRCRSTRPTSGDEYQYLQRSKLPMLYFQPSLLRLPIPALEKTCERYLNAQKPLLIEEAYGKTKATVDRFSRHDGPILQAMLKEKDAQNKHTSYISEPWFDMYLRDRAPLPINYNPLMMMNPDPKAEYNNQLIRTTNILVTSMRFYKSLKEKCLEPEVFHLNPKKSDTDRYRKVMKFTPTRIATYASYIFKAFPLDMSQYQGLFAGTRIPELEKDRICRGDDPKHILLMRRGHFYAVNVLNEAGEVEQPSVIMARVKYVLEDNCQPTEYPLGVLTTENRDVWASLRHHLIDIGNDKSMKLIDNALFCICLDEGTSDVDNPIPIIRDHLFGDGTNRWFDKSLSMIIAKDGTASVNFEHSWGDGVAVLRYFNEIYKETVQNPFVHPETKPQDNQDIEKSVQKIEINLDDRMRTGILNAQNNHNSIIDSLDMNFMKFEGINKNICKKQKISPDAMMQLGFQLGFYKQHGQFVGTYESCSTAVFRHGRTETMRPCTTATKEFCEAVTSSTRPANHVLREMMTKCSNLHGQLTKDAAMGQGFDRHLFGLRHVAECHGMPKPGLFEDTAYANINHNILSTSTLSSPALLAGGFGPVVKDGYGIGYNIQDSYCGSVVSSYKGHRNGAEFIECLRSAYKDIADILNTTKPPETK